MRLLSIRFPILLLSLITCGSAAWSAENLHLREGVSFVHDLDQGFPLLGDKMDDVALSTTHPTFLFFGAPGDLNTNRQAKRIVDLYNKYHGDGVKFVVVDVDHPANKQAKALIKSYYQAYIPCGVIFDKGGKVVWTKVGEVENSVMASQLDKQL